MEGPHVRAPRGTEPVVRVEPAGIQGIPAQRKPGAAMGLSLPGSHDQLPPEVDGSAQVATADTVREARRDVAEAPGRHCKLLPHQGSLRSSGSPQWKHPHVDQPRPGLSECPLSAAEGQTTGRDQRRIHRGKQNEESRVKWPYLTNSCRDPFVPGCGGVCPPVNVMSESYTDVGSITRLKEGTIMVQAASLFNQLLQHFPRTEFASLVKKHQAERAAKGFTCWTQFVAMTFCQLAHADSLREICNGLACSEGKLVHLGITNAPNKSTLSYANEHRPAVLFEDLFHTSLNRFRSQDGMGARKAKFRFKNKLLSLDSTTISLCLDLFPWAKFRRAKGGVKAHVLLDHDDYLPSYVLITEAKKSDVRIAQSLDLNAGSIVAIDRGYCDYALFGKWDGRGVFFVTRLKDNAAYEVVESAIGPLPRNILADELIRFTGAKAVKDYPHPIRRVVVWDPINEREIVLLTNLLFGAHQK